MASLQSSHGLRGAAGCISPLYIEDCTTASQVTMSPEYIRTEIAFAYLPVIFGDRLKPQFWLGLR
jgi:hypothetical protein